MDRVLLLYIALVLITGALAAIAIWSPRHIVPKLSALVLAAAFMPTAYVGLTELLSRPKPASLEWAQQAAEEATVLGSKVEEGVAIYVFLQLPDLPEPRAYVLPWSRRAAEELQNAQRQAQASGRDLVMAKPFEGNPMEQERLFYPRPQDAPPPKQMPAQPFGYQHPKNAS